MRAPDFWARDGALPRLLSPLGWLYGTAGALRQASATPLRLDVPVICVGNITAGGVGKTPVALSLARLLTDSGRRPHFLSRGYGGRLAGPVRVDPQIHGYRDVGDEPLLLARAAPCWISRDRAAGGRAAQENGAGVVIMDDGFQNPSLAKDLSLVVVDGATGFGNGRVIPAGPLREPVARGLSRASALVVVGPDRCGLAALARHAGLTLLRAGMVPGPEAAALAGKRAVAFAGIGRPAKFFDTLRGLDVTLLSCHAFADHHPFTRAEIETILEEARSQEAIVLTTAKDFVRLPQDLRPHVGVLGIELRWEDEAALHHVLRKAWERDGNE
ncbi:tetraacyldisaccharide 4'-kinase [Telmatospirillum sp. J64-1]|uniref:tetraacyldisaccharide 4'-kinase n=1 Tax=Telmatospirillum sp. J64-1 TaxID=2502183 RepID=UPI00115E02D5|nr:tetraacyldisaccharide 4'-kinase [Telmatospirillum sp. J64-1]